MSTSLNKICPSCLSTTKTLEGRKEIFYLTTHSTHFIYSHMNYFIWTQVGFEDYSADFESCQVDGDLLLRLTDDELSDSLHVSCKITRKRSGSAGLTQHFKDFNWTTNIYVASLVPVTEPLAICSNKINSEKL